MLPIFGTVGKLQKSLKGQEIKIQKKVGSIYFGSFESCDKKSPATPTPLPPMGNTQADLKTDLKTSTPDSIKCKEELESIKHTLDNLDEIAPPHHN